MLIAIIVEDMPKDNTTADGSKNGGGAREES